MKLKTVLIISPNFPPFNAADMHRVRMSLPYFADLGWNVEVVTVKPIHSEIIKDDLLVVSIPGHIKIHYVNAFSKKWTRFLGLGSIALRSFLFYRRKVNQLLKEHKYDLIYFSTTQFPLCVLGNYWKEKYGIPFIIDMQDPWHSNYYLDKPKSQRPRKYWFSYRLNKWLEPKAMNNVDGLISVSDSYLTVLSQRYRHCSQIPQATIPFGSFELDLEIALRNKNIFPSILKTSNKISIVYIGRGGYDMQKAVSLLFTAFSCLLKKQPGIYSRFHFYFIGTSYATNGKASETISPIAIQHEIKTYVTELTARIPFYQSLNTLADADGLFIPGSDDPKYSASKVYPYVQVRKPLLAIFHRNSNVVDFLRNCKIGTIVTFSDSQTSIQESIEQFLLNIYNGLNFNTEPDCAVFEQYSAKRMTEKQCRLFDEVTL
ncbi:MAG TPA: glycosyltransferase [Candidatus Nitrosocosmicus sp.]